MAKGVEIKLISQKTVIPTSLKTTRLNTIECSFPRENRYSEDVRLMTCTVWGFGEKGAENLGTFNDVLSVEGNIKVLASVHSDKTYIKTHPYVGMPAHIETKRLSFPKDSLVLVVTPAGHPLKIAFLAKRPLA